MALPPLVPLADDGAIGAAAGPLPLLCGVALPYLPWLELGDCRLLALPRSAAGVSATVGVLPPTPRMAGLRATGVPPLARIAGLRGAPPPGVIGR